MHPSFSSCVFTFRKHRNNIYAWGYILLIQYMLHEYILYTKSVGVSCKRCMHAESIEEWQQNVALLIHIPNTACICRCEVQERASLV